MKTYPLNNRFWHLLIAAVLAMTSTLTAQAIYDGCPAVATPVPSAITNFKATVNLSPTGGYLDDFNSPPAPAGGVDGRDVFWSFGPPAASGTYIVINTNFSNSTNGTGLSVYRDLVGGNCYDGLPVPFEPQHSNLTNGTACVDFTYFSGLRPYNIFLESGTNTGNGGSAVNLNIYVYPGGPPTGDNFSNCFPIASLPYSDVNRDLGGFGDDAVHASWPNAGVNADALWRLPSGIPVGTQITVDTLGSSFPTFLAVMDNSTFSLMGTNIFGATLPNQSTVTFTTTNSNSDNYVIVIEGVNGAMSLANLNVRIGGAGIPAVNDDKPLQQLGLGNVSAAAFSPDESYVITAGEGGTVLWDVTSGTRLRTRPNTSSDVAYSADGVYIAFAQGDKTMIVEAETDEIIRTLTHPGKQGRQFLAFSPNLATPRLAVGFDQEGQATIWDYTTGTLMVTVGDDLETHVKCMVFSTDGLNLVLGHGDFPVPHLFDVRAMDATTTSTTGISLNTAPDHNSPIISLEMRNYSGQDYLLSCSETTGGANRARVILWNFAPKLAMKNFEPDVPGSEITGATMKSDLTAIAVGNETQSRVQIYDATQPSPILAQFISPVGDRMIPKYSPNGTHLSIIEPIEAEASLWNADATTVSLTLELEGYTGPLQASVPVTTAGREEVWTGHASGKASRWSVTSGNQQQTITGVTQNKYLAFSPDGSLAFFAEPVPLAPPTRPWVLRAQRTSDGAIIYQYDPQLLGPPPGFFVDPTPNNVSVSGDGARVAMAGFDRVMVWTVATQAPVMQWDLSVEYSDPGNTVAAQIVTLNSDGTRAFFYASGMNPPPPMPGRIYNVAPGPPIGQFANLESGGGNDFVAAAAFSPDGSMLATGHFAGNTSLRNGTTGAYLRSLFISGEGESICQEFSADGTKILVGSGGGNTRMYDTATGRLLRKLAPEQVTFSNKVLSLSFLEDETRLASGCSDGRTFIWELDPPRAIFVAAGDPDPLNNALTVQTTSLTEYAAEVSVRRDYRDDDVRILSSFRDAPFVIPIDYDSDTVDDSYASTTEANLRDAILTWGNEKCDYGRRLFIYMTDHGLRESGETHFILNACETISATEVDAILDEYQNPALNGGKKHEVTLVVDCCYSGEFIDACAPTGAQDRTIISSTGEEDLAVFLPSPDLTSFTEQFFGAAYMGASIKSGFDASNSFFQTFSIANQIPELTDEEGTGAGTATGFLGKSWIYASGGGGFSTLGNLGTVACVPGGVLAPNTTVTITVDVESAADPTDVYAQVLEPAPDTLSANPVTNLPLITLIETVAGHWEGTYVVTEDGTYTFGVYGRYTGARRSETEIVFANVNEVDPEETRPLVAVLAAGQDDAAGQTGVMDDQALELTARAYQTIEDRQYQTSNIRVLGPAVLASYGTSLPTSATFANFSAALNAAVSGQPGARLFVSLIGPVDGSDNFKFQTGQTITPAQLDSLLDPLQVADPDLEVVILMDCPKAGRYESALIQTNRFLVLGTDATGDGFYLPSPTYQAYSRRFLEASRQGRDLYDSNLSGEEFADLFSLPLPILKDQTGAAVPLLAIGKYLGRRGVFASDAGELATICNIAPDQVPTTLAQVQVYVDFQEGLEPTQVTAQAVPDPPDQFVGDAPTIVMTRVSPVSWRWYVPAAQMAALFPTNGSFLVTYEASYPTTDTLPRQSQAEGSKVSLVDPGTDIYEPAPYLDSTSGTTANILLDLQPQIHTLHTNADQDWGIVYQGYESVNYPYSLHFDLNLPTNAILRVEIYENGPGFPATQTELIPWTDETRDVTWLGSGYNEVYFRVSLDSGDVSSFLGYQVTFVQNTGANNGIATTIGASQLQANWSTNSVPVGSQGFNVLRSDTGAAGTFTTQVNSTPVPVPSTTGACPGSGCASLLDSGLSPLTVYFYQVQVVPAAGTPSAWTGTFYGYTSQATVTPTPTASPTATATASPTPSPTPGPNAVTENWTLYE